MWSSKNDGGRPGRRSGDPLHFTNSLYQALPVEQETRNFHRQVRDACFSWVSPSPVVNPRLVALSTSALRLLDMDESELSKQEVIEYFSGNRTMPGSKTAAHCYCGFQYGAFSGQLGDGAVMYLGGVTNSAGEEWEVQLKGAGCTPYSRVNTDGRKMLRSSIREFLCSEALHHLGVPTTRAGSLMTSDTPVSRDLHYTGQSSVEAAAVLLRLAPSFIRVGSFEVCKPKDPKTGMAGPSAANLTLLRQMVDYVIKTFYPQIAADHSSDPDGRILAFFAELSKRTAHMVALWQTLGFCHGVLNTDNISALGLSMDYGPFQFMDAFDPDHLSNASDHWARHTYSRQVACCRWCLERLAEVLQQVVGPSILSTVALDQAYDLEFSQHYLSLMRAKLGLTSAQEGDETLVSGLLDTMQRTGADFSKTFRALSKLLLPGTPGFQESVETLTSHLLHNCCCSAASLRHIYRKRTCADPVAIQRSLWVLQMHPELLPTYHQEALRAVQDLNDRQIVSQVEDLSEEEKHRQDAELWATWLRDYTARLRREVALLYPHSDLQQTSSDRSADLDRTNPRFVLKNHILQTAITRAQAGDYTSVRTLAKMVTDPYSDTPGLSCLSDDKERSVMHELLLDYDQGPPEEEVRRTIT